MTVKKELQALLDSESLAQLENLSPALLKQSIYKITSDSREVVPGTVFVAIQGGTQDGYQFIEGALEKGALFIIGDKKLASTPTFPYLQVKNARKTLAEMAARLNDQPSHELLMIGITGTSGKTTTTYLVESILKEAGHQVGVIGTINFRYGDKIYPSTHTTPGAPELQALLKQMKTEGCTAVVMEVSSHALKQYRVAGIAFDGMVFTNLSPEHLDFHPTMEDYYRSKAMLFEELADYAHHVGKSPVGVINLEDEAGKRLFQQVKSTRSSVIQPIGFKTDPNLQVGVNGIFGTLNGISIESPLTGDFNHSNLAAAVTLTHGLGIPDEVISNGVRKLKGIPGRLERVENSLGLHIWVDYAHKPDALEKVLQTLKRLQGGGRLITVFGCGGDRDRQKRPVMGKIAVTNSDWVWITSDNPRSENPESIIQEILQGTQGHSSLSVEVDRKKAIVGAIGMSQPGDLILIAGKGHETYQIFGAQKVHFDDREIAAEACSLIIDSR